jgi:hypothetical protein
LTFGYLAYAFTTPVQDQSKKGVCGLQKIYQNQN